MMSVWGGGKGVEHEHLRQRGVWNKGGSCVWVAEVEACQEVVQINSDNNGQTLTIDSPIPAPCSWQITQEFSSSCVLH